MLQAIYTHFCRPRGVKLVSADVCARRKALVDSVRGGDRAFYDLYCADCAGPEPLPAPEVVSVAESTTPPKAAPSGRLNTERPAAKAPSRPVCSHAPGRDAARTPGGAAFSQQMEAPMSQEHAPEHGPMCRRPGCDQPQKITATGKPMGYCEAHWRESIAKGRAKEQRQARANPRASLAAMTTTTTPAPASPALAEVETMEMGHTPCAHPGCAEPREDGSHFCPVHRDDYWGGPCAHPDCTNTACKHRDFCVEHGPDHTAEPAPRDKRNSAQPVMAEDGAEILVGIVRQQMDILTIQSAGNNSPAVRAIVNTLNLCLEGLANRGYLPGWNEAAA